MIRSTLRRAATVAAVVAATTVSGLPLLSGTALAATVTPQQDSAANDGTLTLTLTGGPTMFTATAATLINHDNPSYTIPASALSQGNPAQPDTRTAQFPLLNKLPGVYDISMTEPVGSDSCTSCFTITGLPPTMTLHPPTEIVTGSTAIGSVTVANPARGSDYPKTRMHVDMSGVAGLHASQMTLEYQASPDTWTPVDLSDSGGDIVGYIGPAAGIHLPPNTTLTLPLRFGATSGAPTGDKLTVTMTAGNVDGSGAIVNPPLATASALTKLTNVASGSNYQAITPVRMLNTRTGTGHSGALTSHGSFTVVIGGTSQVPSNATAVAINLAAFGATNPGFLTAYAAGASKPTGSTLSYPKTATVANLAVVPLSPTTHAITIDNGSATTVDVVGDVVGYYAPTGAVYKPLTPQRILDTTKNSDTPIAAGGARTVQVGGAGGVPLTGVSAVAVDVAVTRPQKAGYLRIFPTGSAEPSTSNLNFAANQTIANLVIVPLGSGGRITVANHSAGTAHIVVDVEGYFASSGSGSSMHPLAITRVFNSATDGTKQPLAGHSAMTISLGGKAGLPASGLTMVAVNLAVAEPQGAGYLTAYAGNATRPGTSNANFTTGQAIADLALVKVPDTGAITIYNGSSAPVTLLVDVVGWG
jgi:hypothetical protein